MESKSEFIVLAIVAILAIGIMMWYNTSLSVQKANNQVSDNYDTAGLGGGRRDRILAVKGDPKIVPVVPSGPTCPKTVDAWNTKKYSSGTGMGLESIEYQGDNIMQDIKTNVPLLIQLTGIEADQKCTPPMSTVCKTEWYQELIKVPCDFIETYFDKVDRIDKEMVVYTSTQAYYAPKGSVLMSDIIF